jgi:hypothetical protein
MLLLTGWTYPRTWSTLSFLHDTQTILMRMEPSRLGTKLYRTKKEASMHKNLDKTANNYGPLPCKFCGKDLLEMGNGNFVWVMNSDQTATLRRIAAYWACWECDGKIEATLDIEKYSTRWKNIAELLNPLEHKVWDDLTSHLIKKGEVSEPAAETVKELKRVLAQVVRREPTEKDVVRYRQIRMMDGL